jgi:response regulator RpfG family c-di-GMP phosphodiesterase
MILLVDDDARVLEGYGRSLRRHFKLLTADAGEKALQLLASEPTISVIVSDMSMPNMNGLQLMMESRRRFPDVVRIMLTGNADQRTAVEAVNRGEIFRFLCKPCPADELARAINAGVAQRRLVLAERQLLEDTLRGSLAALGEVLAMVNPTAFGSAERLSSRMRELAVELNLPELWMYETTGRLSQIGCVVLPEDLVEKVRIGTPLSNEEKQRFACHPGVGAELIGRIPRLEPCAEAIRYQLRNFDGSGSPADGPSGEKIPLGARLLRVAVEFELLLVHAGSREGALGAMRAHTQCFDPTVLRALIAQVDRVAVKSTTQVALRALREGMIFAEDLRTTKGLLIVSRGQLVTSRLRDRLVSFIHSGQISGDVTVTTSPASPLGK